MAKARTSSPTEWTGSTWGCVQLLLMVPGAVAIYLFQADGFDPAPLPDHHSWLSFLRVPARNDHVLRGAEKLANGLVEGPEDLACDATGHVLYTGCGDGWIKRVRLSKPAASVSVENWTYIGGRPIGLAIGADSQLIVADALKVSIRDKAEGSYALVESQSEMRQKGLVRVTKEGAVELLTDEAEGVKFGLPNSVDVASDGVIYFTDTSYKYKFGNFTLNFLEGRPYGRLMSFDPSTNQTKVLLKDLYFANGVALSPAQDFLVFCETILRRCRKYHIQGEKRGTVDDFVDNLPGMPDNIHLDGEGHLFSIAFPTGRTFTLYMLTRYPFLRKALMILGRFVRTPNMGWNSGVLGVSSEGKPVALYTDPALSDITSAVKAGNHLYFGSLVKDYISRLDLIIHPARPA